MDGTANEAKGLQVKGFPTLKLYLRGSKEAPIDLDQGARTEEGLIQFLKSKLPYELAIAEAASEPVKEQQAPASDGQKGEL